MKSILFRLFIAFVSVIFFLILLGGYAAYTEKIIYEVQLDANGKVMETKDLQMRLLENRLLLYRLLGTTHPDKMDKLKNDFLTNRISIESEMIRLNLRTTDLSTLKKGNDRIISLHYNFFTNLALEELNNDSKELFLEIENSLKAWEEEVETVSGKYVRSTLNRSFLVTFLLCTLALVVSLFWAFYLRKRLTDKGKAEESVSILQSYLQNVIDSMPSILISVDNNLVVNRWNTKASQYTKINLDRVESKQIDCLIPFLASITPLIKIVMESGTTKRSSRLVDPSDSEKRIWEATIYPLGEERSGGAVIRLDEITERIRLEEVMVQTEKMMSIGGLAAGMAHEINNPLAGIIQTSYVMEKRLSSFTMKSNMTAASKVGIDMERLRAYMEDREIFRMMSTIKEGGVRIASIVDNMLSFSRREGARFEDSEPIDLVESTLKLAATDFDLKKHQDFKSLKVIKDFEEDLPLVPCQRTKIQQVILNILKNGAQAMHNYSSEENGRFIIRLRRNGNFLSMEFEDNGPGMDEEVRKRVFEPFFTTKDTGIGTGLGLSVSYFIICEDHGGEMNVLSTLGKGSIFIILLPLNR